MWDIRPMHARLIHYIPKAQLKLFGRYSTGRLSDYSIPRAWLLLRKLAVRSHL